MYPRTLLVAGLIALAAGCGPRPKKAPPVADPALRPEEPKPPAVRGEVRTEVIEVAPGGKRVVLAAGPEAGVVLDLVFHLRRGKERIGRARVTGYKMFRCDAQVIESDKPVKVGDLAEADPARQPPEIIRTKVLATGPKGKIVVVGGGGESRLKKGLIGEVRRGGRTVGRIELTDAHAGGEVLAGGAPAKVGDDVVFERKLPEPPVTLHFARHMNGFIEQLRGAARDGKNLLENREAAYKMLRELKEKGVLSVLFPRAKPGLRARFLDVRCSPRRAISAGASSGLAEGDVFEVRHLGKKIGRVKVVTLWGAFASVLPIESNVRPRPGDQAVLVKLAPQKKKPVK